MSARYVDVEIEVMVDIDEALAPKDLFSRFQTDDWKNLFYTFRDEDEVLRHWAYNAAVNGVRDISRLDGWADVLDDAVRLRVVS